MVTHEKFTSHLLIFLYQNLTNNFYGRDEKHASLFHRHWLGCSVHMFVNHLLLVDQVGRLHDQAQEVRDVVGPLVQHFVGIFLALEIDDAIESVDFGLHGLAHHHRVEAVLGRVLAQTKKLGHSRIKIKNMVFDL